MSRLLSFLKTKKDKEDGDYPGSPPPSPRAKTDSEHKSVKQLKKRKRDKKKRAEATGSGSSMTTTNALDANGNSMTGKSRSPRSNGDTVMSTEGDCDSLRDVDSICEDEVDHIKMKNDSLKNIRNGELSDDATKSTKLKRTISEDGLLVDNFMDEAFDNLEHNNDPDSDNDLNDSENIKQINGKYPTVPLDANGHNDIESDIKSDIKESSNKFEIDASELSGSYVRPLSSDTAGTVYSSCDPDSDYSTPEEFFTAERDALVERPNSSNQSHKDIGECAISQSDVPELVVTNDCSQPTEEDGQFGNHSIPQLEICMEIESKGRTSILVDDILEARNTMVDICEVDPSSKVSLETFQDDVSVKDNNLDDVTTPVFDIGECSSFEIEDIRINTDESNLKQSSSNELLDYSETLIEDLDKEETVIASYEDTFAINNEESEENVRPVLDCIDEQKLSLECRESIIEDLSISNIVSTSQDESSLKSQTVNESVDEVCDNDKNSPTICDTTEDVLSIVPHPADSNKSNEDVLSIVPHPADSNKSNEAELKTVSSRKSSIELDASLSNSVELGDGDSVCSPDRLSVSSNSSRKASRSLEQQLSIEEELSKHSDSQLRREAEARLAQRRAARAEARELRLKELEKQQQQNPETNDDASDMSDGGSGGRSCRSSMGRSPAVAAPAPTPPTTHYSRRSSEDSTNEEATSKEIRELEEKFRGAMISNAQLDNEKSQLNYQVEALKDVKSDITEQLTQLKKEHKKKCSEHESLRKVYTKLQEESKMVRRVLEERDELIQEFGLLVVGGDEESEDEDGAALACRQETEDGLVLPRPIPMKRVLLTQEAAEILEKGAAKGSLEWRLRRVVEHKRELEDELRRVNLELEDQLNSQRQNTCLDSNIQKEANKTVNEYKFRVQKAEAEVGSLQANVNRLEALVSRYKSQSEELEKSEEELKVDKRKLQRELREAQSRLDELETTNSHLLRRFEKLKNARSNLLKDLSQDPV